MEDLDTADLDTADGTLISQAIITLMVEYIMAPVSLQIMEEDLINHQAL